MLSKFMKIEAKFRYKVNFKETLSKFLEKFWTRFGKTENYQEILEKEIFFPKNFQPNYSKSGSFFNSEDMHYAYAQRLSQLILDDALYRKVTRSSGILLKQVSSVVYYETISLIHTSD